MDYLVEQLRYQLREDPTSRVFFKLGEHLRREGELDEAVQVLTAGLEHHPTYVAAWVSLGRALLGRGDSEAAATALQHAVELDPENAVASRHAGEAAIATGDWVGAIKGLKRARALSGADEALDERIRYVEEQLADNGELEVPEPEPRRQPVAEPFDAEEPPGDSTLDDDEPLVEPPADDHEPSGEALPADDSGVFPVDESSGVSPGPGDDVFDGGDGGDNMTADEPFEDDASDDDWGEDELEGPPAALDDDVPRETMAIPLASVAPAQQPAEPPSDAEPEPVFDLGGDEPAEPETEPLFPVEVSTDPETGAEPCDEPANERPADEPVFGSPSTVEEPPPDAELTDEAPQADDVIFGTTPQPLPTLEAEAEAGPEAEVDEELEDEDEDDDRRSEELPLPTMTLARLALDQGDLELAEKTLRGVLARNPEHAEAAALLARLTGEPVPEPTEAGPDSGQQARVEALRRWLDAVRLASEKLQS